MALAEAAFGSVEGLEVSSVEVDREGPSYTCDTLEEIHSSNPDSQIFFLAGSDAALGIGDWHRPERVLELASFAVAPRSDVARDAVTEAFERLGARDRLEFFEMPRVEISSTLVRERVAAGRPFKHLVPQEVAEMIDNEDLYGSK
jgi:nicotinate-nucleotide adenylyltransferase